MSEAEAAAARRALTDSLSESGALPADWRPAFDHVPRHAFLPTVYWSFVDGETQLRDRDASPGQWLASAYEDIPAVTQWDDGDRAAGQNDYTSSLSMPTMVALMLRDLDVREGDRVLEIGTGPGFNAALLTHRLGGDNVVTVEVDATLAKTAEENLTAIGLHPRVLVGDGAHGSAQDAPFDRVVATCSVTEIPPAWLAQTRPGGVIVTPLSTLFGGGATVRLTVATDGTASGTLTGSCDFMRLRQQRYQAPPVDDYLPGEWPGDADRSSTALDPETIGHQWLGKLAIGLRLPDVYYRRSPASDMTTWWLFDTAVTSWATVDSVPGATEFDVRQSGPRRLWDEVEDAWTRWVGNGRPGYDRLGLTVGADGEHTAWLDTPDTRWSAATGRRRAAPCPPRSEGTAPGQ